MTNFIESTSETVLVCSECQKDFLRKTYKIGSYYYCKLCAARIAFGKAAETPLALMEYINPNLDYKVYLERAKDILLNGRGSMQYRASRAKKCIPATCEIRKITKTKYVILSPIGRIFVEVPRAYNPMSKDLPPIDPQSPVKSICNYVREALNKGLPIGKVAEYIWEIRGPHDYITALMYPEDNRVLIVWPKGQKEIFIT